MTVSLPRKVALRVEHTGAHAPDRAQRMAQQVGAAHEQTKNVVSDIDTRTRRGVLRISMGNSDKTLTATENTYGVIDITGALTAGRNLTVAPATDETARVVWVSNQTTGGFAVSVIVSSTLAGVAVAAGVRRPVLVSAAGVTALT